MKKRIKDCIFWVVVFFYTFLGIAVSVIIVTSLMVILSIRRSYFFISSHIDRLIKEIKEKMAARKLENLKKALQKEIKKREKRAARYEKLLVELRERKEKKEKPGIGTYVLRGQIMVNEEGLKENYGWLRYRKETLEEVENELAQIKKDKEKLLESKQSDNEDQKI